MSTQAEREAAARAFAAGGPFADFDAIIDAPEGWYLPDGSDSGELGWVELDEVLDRWKAHARAQLAREAATAAPAMTLEAATTAALAAELERRGCRVLTPVHARMLEHNHDVAWNAYEALRGLERIVTGEAVLSGDMRDALRALAMHTMPHRRATWTNPAGGP